MALQAQAMIKAVSKAPLARGPAASVPKKPAPAKAKMPSSKAVVHQSGKHSAASPSRRSLAFGEEPMLVGADVEEGRKSAEIELPAWSAQPKSAPRKTMKDIFLEVEHTADQYILGVNPDSEFIQPDSLEMGDVGYLLAEKAAKYGLDWTDFGLTQKLGKAASFACFLLLLVLFLAFVFRPHYDHDDDNVKDSKKGNITNPADIKIADINGVKANSKADFDGLATAFVVSLAGIAGSLAAFRVLRKRIPMIYEGRMNEPLSERGKLYHRISDRYEDKEADAVIASAGLDCWMFLEFQSMHCRMCLMLGFVLLPITGTVNFLHGENKLGVISRISINNVPAGSAWFWVHAVMVHFVVITTCTIAHRTHARFCHFRVSWLSAMPKPRSNTLMVEDIPDDFRSDAKLSEYFTNLFGPDSVERSYVVRYTNELRVLVRALHKANDAVLYAHEKWRRQGSQEEDRPMRDVNGEQQDMILEAEQQLQTALQAVQEERRRLEDAADDGFFLDGHEASGVCSRTGFVTFSTRKLSQLAANRQYRESGDMRVSYPPDPSDVIYEDLMENAAKRNARRWGGRLSLVGLFFGCVPVIIFISGLTSLQSLQGALPFIKDMCAAVPFLQAFLQGVLAALALKGFNIVLPKILYTIIDKFFCLKAHSWAQLQLHFWFFSFQIFFVVLANAAGGSFFRKAQEILASPAQIFYVLADKMPDVSTFYLDFMLVGWLIVSIEVCRPIQLTKYFIFRTMFGPNEAYRRAQNDDMAFFSIGTRMTRTGIMGTIVFVFSLTTPLVCVVGYWYFVLARVVYRYLFVNAEQKKPDLGGAFWVQSLTFIYVSLVLFVCLMMGIFITKSDDFKIAVFAATSLVPMAIAWRRLKRMNWQGLPFERVVDMDRCGDIGHVNEGVYIQSECLETELPSELKEVKFTMLETKRKSKAVVNGAVQMAAVRGSLMSQQNQGQSELGNGKTEHYW